MIWLTASFIMLAVLVGLLYFERQEPRLQASDGIGRRKLKLRMLVFRSLASAICIGTALMASQISTQYSKWIIIGLTLGTVGTATMMVEGRRTKPPLPALLVGPICVFLGHTSYIVAFVSAMDPDKLNLWLSLPFLAICFAAFVYRRRVLRFFFPVIGYMGLLLVMVVGAWQYYLAHFGSIAGPLIAAVGAGLLFCSELATTHELFIRAGIGIFGVEFLRYVDVTESHEMRSRFITRAWHLPVYYTGQLMIAISLHYLH